MVSYSVHQGVARLMGSSQWYLRPWSRAVRNGSCSHAHPAFASVIFHALPAERMGTWPTHSAGAINLHIVNDSAMIEQITQAIILVSLFSGLKIRLPITS
jgi:hypothetical protein